jgi:hypothetical protein
VVEQRRASGTRRARSLARARHLLPPPIAST